MASPTAGSEANLALQLLVRQSADEVVQALPGEIDLIQRDALGHLACALVITEGVPAAHEFAESTITALDLRESDQFSVWADLYGAGDADALPKARRTLGLAAAEVPFVEAFGFMNLKGLHTAERMVQLVEKGDKMLTGLARGLIQNVDAPERTALFARLYQAGDEASLDSAVVAAKQAKAYTERTEDIQYYYRSEQALYDMASHAAKQGDFKDALKLMDHLKDSGNKLSLHTQLYAVGHASSLKPLLDYLKEPDSVYTARSVQRSLAAAGYKPALRKVRKQATASARKTPKDYTTDDRLADLTVLHDTGDGSAAKLIEKTVHSANRPANYLRTLAKVGLREVAIDIATQQHLENPSPETERQLLDYQHDNRLWSKVFRYILTERKDVGQAADYVWRLANQAR